MQKYTKKVLTGGTKLGSGSFGCVVTPPIACSSATKVNKSMISKIAHIPDYDKESYQIELDIYKYLKRVDPKQRHIIGIVDECQLNTTAALARQPKDFLDTKWVDNKGDEVHFLGSNAALSYKLSDDDIHKNYCTIDRSRAPRNMIQINGGVKTQAILREPNGQLFKLFKKYVYNVMHDLLLGVKMMHEHELAHRDIKPDNIVTMPVSLKSKSMRARSIKAGDESNKYPLARFIDFGLAEIVTQLSPKNIMNVNNQGTPGYIPIELVILDEIRIYIEDYGVYVNLASSQVKNIVIRNSYTDYNNNMRKMYEALNVNKSTISLNKSAGPEIDTKEYVNITDISKLYDKFVEQFRTNTFRDKYYSKVVGYIYKTDIFALGLVFALLKKRMSLKNPDADDLIRHMLQIDPDDRYSVYQCLEHPLFKTQKVKPRL